jgi:hypothetical protein
MEMVKEQSEKLKKYLINADPFLWDVLLAKNKKGRIKELQNLNLLQSYPEKSNANYSKINQDLLVELGIEKIFKEIIQKQIEFLFKPEHLSYFRRCWEQGQTPDMKYLRKEKLYHKPIFGTDEKTEGLKTSGHKSPAFIFLDIHRQYEFVEHWTVFAGLWFEEIEDYLKK